MYLYPKMHRCEKCGFEQKTNTQQHHPSLIGNDPAVLFCPACMFDWMKANLGTMKQIEQ